jgi:nitroreductase
MRDHERGGWNEVLDNIIASRRSIRSFTDEIPPRAMIESIIRAGLAAPFAEAAVGAARDFRRFIVFPKGSKALELVGTLLREKGRSNLERIRARAPKDAPFVRKLEALAEGRIPGIGTASYLIAVAERKGVPAVEQQAIAHCLQNMWLKATALRLGFHLVSAMAMLADEPRFWELAGLPAGAWDLNGCAIGMPVVVPAAKPRPTLEEATVWMS